MLYTMTNVGCVVLVSERHALSLSSQINTFSFFVFFFFVKNMDLIWSTVSSDELRVSSHWLYTEIKHHKSLMWAEPLTQGSSAQPDV